MTRHQALEIYKERIANRCKGECLKCDSNEVAYQAIRGSLDNDWRPASEMPNVKIEERLLVVRNNKYVPISLAHFTKSLHKLFPDFFSKYNDRPGFFIVDEMVGPYEVKPIFWKRIKLPEGFVPEGIEIV